jgi:hypothetical protein
MRDNNKATITIDQARKLQQAILEGEYSFGLEGQLNITLTRHDKGEFTQEPKGAQRKRTETLAAQIVEHLGLDAKKVFAQQGRIVVKDPNQDMPYIFAELNIPVEWDSFAKGVQVSKAPASRPSGNAAVVSAKDAPSSLGKYTRQVLDREYAGLNPPDTVLGKLLLRDAVATGSGQSRSI